jgi:hypothetical protein
MQVPDPKAIRDNLASNMILLKTFGFDDQEDRIQIIDQPGSVIIAFDWSDANEMLIEYQVPMSYLGKTNDLNGKALSIGWKINSVSLPGGSNLGSLGSTSTFAARASTAGSGRGGAGRANSNIPTSTSDFPSGGGDRFKEPSTWTKYMLTF